MTELIDAVDNAIEKVRTRSLDLSFNEILTMYKENDLIIDPEYQRLFRWPEDKQSRFIESVILEMPLPPLFLIEINDNKYELIDGLQRISSYLHFRGAHPDRKEEDGKNAFLKLDGCDVVKELNGKTFNDLPRALEVKLKRNFVRVEILRLAKDNRIRYHMFKRLNTGGESLSDQEIRNCTIRLLSPIFNDFIITCASNVDFITCIDSVSEDKIDKKYNEELVLRFFAFKNNRNEYVHEVGEFLSEYMENVSDPTTDKNRNFNQDEEKRIFDKTFKLLAMTLGESSFTKTNSQGQPKGAFLSYHFECFSICVAEIEAKIDPSNAADVAKLKATLITIKTDAEFIRMTTSGGKNYKLPLERRLTFVQTHLARAFP